MNTGLLALHHSVFTDSNDKPDRDEILALWSQRLDWSGVGVDRDRYLRGCHNSFASMATDLAGRFSADDPLDIIVIAHATPDADARISLAGTLAAGNTLVFAISDLGRLAPFSALETVRSYPEGRGLVIALDQGTVPYADPQLAALDSAADHAVGLLLGDGGRVDLHSLRLQTNVPPEQVEAVVAAELTCAPVDLAIIGAHVPSGVAHLERRAPADQLCSAVWSALAEEIAAPSSWCRRIAVVEYEPALHTVGLLHLELSAPACARSGEPATEIFLPSSQADMRCAP
jgi:hypothetical protein